jgi:hypothetical protein
MDCERIKPLLTGFLYKDLEEAEKQVVQEHLGGCTDCQDDILSLKKTREVLECWPDEEISSRMVFVNDHQPWYRKIVLPIESFSSLRLKPLRTAAFGLAAVFLLLAVGNTRVSYRQGDFSLDFSLIPKSLTAVPDNAAMETLVQGLEEKQAELLVRLIQESEMRQMDELDRRLKKAVFALESKRQQDRRQDLFSVGWELEETKSRQAKTQEIMNDFIVLARSGAPVSPRRVTR